MLKKLTDEQLSAILDAGISEFAAKGVGSAGMSHIAKRAGISVGVLYKYYADKEALFLACLEHSLAVLESFLNELTEREDKPLDCARALISACQRYSREYGDYVRMYHEITSGSNARYAAVFAERIEDITSRLYSRSIEQAQSCGELRRDADPRLFAFFLDNLLMMMQFSYCCPYYQERMRIYCGEDVLSDDARVTEQLLMFLESAFTFERSQVEHRKN